MNHKRLVADASSLILLTKANVIEKVLERNVITIPSQVYEEVVVKGKEKGRKDAFQIEHYKEDGKVEVRAVKPKIKERIEKIFNLYGGEGVAVALAIELNTPILCDDRKGRNACKVLELKCSSALNILLALYKKGKLTKKEAKESLEKLSRYGWYKQELIDYVKDQIGGE